MSKVITGLFHSPPEAAAAVRLLIKHGFAARDISLIASERSSIKSLGIEDKTRAAEGAAIGAGVGGAIGALAVGLTAVGAIASGGVGLVAAGPLVAALAGAGAGAAAGGAVGTAVGLAIPSHEIRFYQDAFSEGAVLVGVQCFDSEQVDSVTEVFKEQGASKIARL